MLSRMQLDTAKTVPSSQIERAGGRALVRPWCSLFIPMSCAITHDITANNLAVRTEYLGPISGEVSKDFDRY